MTIYSKEGQRGADQRRVNDLMRLTHEPLCRDVNATPPLSVPELKKEWPYLFMQKYLLQQFYTLTGIDLESRLCELAGKGKRELQYFKLLEESSKDSLSSLESQTEEMDPGLAALLVLVSFFQEKEDIQVISLM